MKPSLISRLSNYLWSCRGRAPARPAHNNMRPTNNNMHPTHSAILRDAQGRVPYNHTNKEIPI